MKFTLAAAALAATAIAAPQPAMSNLKKIRQASPQITDVQILQYALTLEHLEATFYKEGNSTIGKDKFAAAGFDATFYTNLQTILTDEATHVAFLQGALGKDSFDAGTYDFGFNGDASLFVQTASILEGVGVSAYLGAAAEIVSADYLTAAGSILTVESRHSAYIRSALKQSPFPSPFDVPLDFNEVYTLAAPFIKSTGNSPMLPFKPFPALNVTGASAGPVKTGSTINIALPVDTSLVAADGKSPIYAAFITVTGPVFTVATPAKFKNAKGQDVNGFTAVVPKAATGKAPVAGQSYVVLTGCNTTVTDETVKAGPGVVEVTPS